MNYIKKGRCIFCLKDKTQTTFLTKPHTIPRSLGGINIGFDICDSCNSYFGTPDAEVFPHLCIEVCVKEIFGIIKHLINEESNRSNAQQGLLRSIYFNFWASKRKISFKPSFKYNSTFLKTFTNQFKRGIYEIFLQEYHLKTGLGLDEQFNDIREYARYNRGNIPLYHLRGDNGILLLEKDISIPKFQFSTHQIETINKYGFYTLMLWGYWFYLEVTPKAKAHRKDYLIREAEQIIGSGTIVNRLIEVVNIMDIDFTLQNFK